MINQQDDIKVIRVLLADDHPLVQDGIRTCFEDIADIDVVGVASNGQELLDQVSELNPDVIITDISMPVMNGLEATRLLAQTHPSIKVLILTMHDNREYIQTALESGASGYLLKDQPASDLIEAIRSIYAGQKYFCSSASSMLHKRSKIANDLTSRERSILMELLNGLNNRSIADKLSISVRTVECHRGNIYRKLDTHSMAGLIRYAKKYGYI